MLAIKSSLDFLLKTKFLITKFVRKDFAKNSRCKLLILLEAVELFDHQARLNQCRASGKRRFVEAIYPKTEDQLKKLVMSTSTFI